MRLCYNLEMQIRSTPRGSLERHQPERRPDAAELLQMRRAAWRKQGVLVVQPTDLDNEVERQILINVGTRLYGPRV